MKKIIYGLTVSTACLFMACTKNNSSNPGNNNGNAYCKQFEISTANSGYNSTDSFQFDAKGRLIHQSNRFDNPPVPAYDFINFTYDGQGHRQNNGWAYTYDASGNISKISATEGTNGITYSVAPSSIISYAVNSSDTDTNTGEVVTSMGTSSYTYNAAGDAVAAVTNIQSSDGSSGMGNYQIIYTDTLSRLNNDPMVHFGNLYIWAGIPIVSHHLIRSIRSNLSINGMTSTTSIASFTYILDANSRPVKITKTTDNSSQANVWNITYQCN